MRTFKEYKVFSLQIFWWILEEREVFSLRIF